MENEVKEPAPKYNYISPEQYLEMERASETKHEYYKGLVFAMAGVSLKHNIIAANLNAIIPSFLRGKNCRMYGSDLRIHIREHTLYTYPDFSIICGKPETTDSFTDNITNPSVIIEILFKSTENYDRGRKFALYRSIKTLQEYILIDSKSILVELFVRQNNNSWNLTEYKQLSDSFHISTIDLMLHLGDIYEDISFEE